MKRALLIIDPQMDFMNLPGAALPVEGAMADMARLSSLIRRVEFDQIMVTLDSHGYFGIERTTFWARKDGLPVTPFQTVTHEMVRSGEFTPVNRDDRDWALTYTKILETKAKRALMIWPVHCEIGTPGHQIEPGLLAAIHEWEVRRGVSALRITKGQNPKTEAYSAFEADVPLGPADELNVSAIERLACNDTIFVAGEASSHCVAETVYSMLNFDSRLARKLVILTDAMSPVYECASLADDMCKKVVALGGRVSSTNLLVA